MEKNGKTISLYFNNDEFVKSKHKDLSCVDCHSGFDPNNIPHKEKIEKVNCLSCHDTYGLEKSSHNKKTECFECHNKHKIQSAVNLYRDIDNCLVCHNQINITGYKKTKHYNVVGNRRLVSCNNCHGKIHTILSKDNVNSPVYASKVLNLCLKCHSVNILLSSNEIHKNIVSSTDSESKKCTNCHGAHSIIMEKTSTGSKGCITCHLNKDWFKNKFFGIDKIPLTTFVEQYGHSIHAKKLENGKESASCSDCHGDHISNPGLDPKASTQRERQPETCGKCHKYISQEYQTSGHGVALKDRIKDAPSCSDCHTEHGIVPITDAKSPVNRLVEVKVCLKCHLNNPDVQKRVNPSAKFIESYEKSAHGIAYHKGNTKAAICTDCHGSHKMKKASDPSSSVNKRQIPGTCAKCHNEIARQYNESIHGTAFQKGNGNSPICTNCHGEHEILPPTDPRSPVASENISSKVCGICHNSVALNSKFDLSGKKFASYQDSYHGLATTSGDIKAANCASCHGVHNIKTSDNPTSSINKANLIQTCGKCHPGANVNFTRGSIHVLAKDKEEGLLYFIATSYLLLIVIIIGGMFFHNLIDFLRKSKSKFDRRRFQHLDHKFGSGLYLRMTVNERIQHFSFMISFIILAVTGFMLKFPNAWWVVPLRNLSESFFEIRGILHRIAAGVMISVSLYHIYYVSFNKRGKELLRDLLPKLKDVYDAIDVMKYNLGFSKSRPKFERFSYIEKAEYWALVWGTVVMGITGFMLWFDNYFLGITSKLMLDVATTIHYYEAWLATLAIIVWHLYFVIFNPDVYPMNLAWIRGTLTEEEMYDEHPLELERIKAREKKDAVMSDESLESD
jgi:cytochrome b subunit of formate dehydrogenase